MPWQDVSLETWAEELNVDLHELRQKNRLIEQVIEARRSQDLTQAQLAERAGVSQPRIAQIENRVRIHAITFDVLLNLLRVLGYDFDITTHRTGYPVTASN